MVIDVRIAPLEMVVGISGDLCYMTYYQTKGKEKVLNSEKSWTSWSSNANNPLIVTNKFSTGFKLAGVNGRWSNNAANAENLLIEHPLFNKCFELSLKRFIEIAKDCTIVNGELMDEFIMTNSRNIVNKKEYNNLVQLRNEQDNKKNNTVATLKESKMSSKDQKVGHVYADSKTGNKFLYLGTVTNTDEDNKKEIKHVYMDAKYTKISSYKTHISDGKAYDSSRRENIKIPVVNKQVPIILVAYSNNSYDSSSKNEHKPFTYYRAYYLSTIKSKKSMSLVEESKTDYFKKYTKEDWDLIKEVYSDNSTNRYRRGENYLKMYGTVTPNFHEDYIEQNNTITQ